MGKCWKKIEMGGGGTLAREDLAKMSMSQMAFKINQHTKFYPNSTMVKCSNPEGGFQHLLSERLRLSA